MHGLSRGLLAVRNAPDLSGAFVCLKNKSLGEPLTMCRIIKSNASYNWHIFGRERTQEPLDGDDLIGDLSGPSGVKQVSSTYNFRPQFRSWGCIAQVEIWTGHDRLSHESATFGCLESNKSLPCCLHICEKDSRDNVKEGDRNEEGVFQCRSLSWKGRGDWDVYMSAGRSPAVANPGWERC